jgi:hypothetical protein
VRAIVNVAIDGDGMPGTYYSDAQKRLYQSLADAGGCKGSGWGCTWTNHYPPGSEPHPAVPYHFKQMAMQQAANLGYMHLLWLDAVMVAVKPIEPIFQQIEEQGYFLWQHAIGTVGEWTSDACLKALNVSRGAAFEMPMLCSGVFGYSLMHPVGKELHEKFLRTTPTMLRGMWHNRNLNVSRHRRVQGHRHDQSVLSLLSAQMGLKGNSTLVSFPEHQNEQTIIVHRP